MPLVFETRFSTPQDLLSLKDIFTQAFHLPPTLTMPLIPPTSKATMFAPVEAKLAALKDEEERWEGWGAYLIKFSLAHHVHT